MSERSLTSPAARIQYRVVDEYESEYLVDPEYTDEPLSFGEVIDLIDSTRQRSGAGPDDDQIGLTDVIRDMNYESADSAEDLVDFVEVRSAFYWQIGAYYDDRAWAWVAEKALEPPRTLTKKYPLTPEEIRVEAEEREAKVAELIRESGVTYSESRHTFKTYDERTRFLELRGLQSEREVADEGVPGLYHLPDGRMVRVHYLVVTVYNPVAR